MIIDKILGKFGYIKEENLKEIMEERDHFAKAWGHEVRARNCDLQYCEELKKDIGGLKKEYRLLEEENRILKSKYSDEVQKRFDLMRFLLKCKIIEETEEPENAESEAEENG